jgi:large subunit ribosomal protein L22
MSAVETPPEVRAQAKWVRSSARKARLITDLIRGRSVPEARTILAFSQRAVARDVEKVLRSAVANAEANHGLAGDDLFVATAYVDEGPTLKRWRPRARGRVNTIFRRTCHITIRLAPAAPAGRARPASAGETAAAAEEKPKRRAAPRKRKTTTTTPTAARATARRPKAAKGRES